MIELQSLPWYTLAIPAALVGGAWVVSKLLRFSYLGTLLVGLAPLALPFVDLPLSKEFVDLQPEALIGGGWLVLLALAFGWVLARPLLSSGLRGFGLARSVYPVLLAAALLVVGLLVTRPELMSAYAPGWKGGAGMVLLSASLLSMSCALARIFRAAFMFSLWALVSLVLASEIFLNKLPQEIVREDLREIESLIPLRVVDGALAKLQVVTPEGAERLKAFVLGGSTSAGFPFSGGRGLAGRLQSALRRAGADVEVQDASVDGASIYDLRKIALEKILPAQPDLVVLTGWTSDSELGANSYGLAGLTEREAIEKVRQAEKVRAIPFAESILTSTMYRYLRGHREEVVTRTELLPRVPVEEYTSELRETVRALRNAGAQVVLVSEAVIEQTDSPYRDAMQQVASAESALYIPAAEIVTKRQDPTVFARGRILSPWGFEVLANGTVDVLREGLAGVEAREQWNGLKETAEAGVLAASSLSGSGVTMIVRPVDIEGDLLFKLRMPEQGTRFYNVVFSVNGEFVSDKRLDSRESVRVRFQLPERYRALPIVELGLHTRASPGTDADRIGSSDTHVPTPVRVDVTEGEESVISIGDCSVYAAEHVSAVAIDPRSGDIVATLRGPEMGALAAWSRGLPRGSIVAGASTQEVALGQLGINGLKSVASGAILAGEGKQRAFVGIVGGTKGEALVKVGDDSVTLSLGSPVVSAYNRFVLEEALVNEQPLKVLTLTSAQGTHRV